MVTTIASATTNTVETVTNAMVTGLGTAGSDILGAMASIIPVVIGVMIAYAIIKVGAKVFSRLTNKG